RQVIVNGFGDADTGNRKAFSCAQQGDLVSGVLGVSATVVQEISDIVRPEDIHEPLILRSVVFQAFEFVAAGAKGAGRCMAQRGNRAGGFLAGIDQLFTQGADDAVQSRINFTYLILVLSGSLNDA